MEKVSITCEDGVVLKGLLFLADDAKAAVQVNIGTGAAKEFYIKFCQFLQDYGYTCLLYDYRGVTKNKASHTYTFLDYGTKDMSAAKLFLQKRCPELPLVLFGHSAGGQQVGFVQGAEDYQAMLGFAVSVGFLPFMTFSYGLQYIFFFYIFTPLSIFFTGYVAAARFKIMSDLPAGVVQQWRAWCSKRNYFFSPKFYGKSVPEGKFKSLTFPVHIFYSDDDPISNSKSVPVFWEHVRSDKPITFTQLDPSLVPGKSIGHFGFFKKKMKDVLWPQVISKLEELLPDR